VVGGLTQELRHSRFNSVISGFTTLAAYAIVLYAMWPEHRQLRGAVRDQCGWAPRLVSLFQRTGHRMH
jgi:hypothetical protein